MRLLFLGDIVGRPGRKAVLTACHRIRKDLGIDLIAANAENASGGVGITPDNAGELHRGGIDVLTTGNHVWKHPAIAPYLVRNDWIVRPGNFPPGAPGQGMCVATLPSGSRVAVLNLLGRTYMEAMDCPFRTAEALLGQLDADVRIRVVDFHAEATSEKLAMGYYLDGQVTAVLGTHTHVQTADAALLPKGTAFISDLGMCGPDHSILGMDSEIIVRRFVSGRPERFHVADRKAGIQGAVLDVDVESGKAVSITSLCLSPEMVEQMVSGR